MINYLDSFGNLYEILLLTYFLESVSQYLERNSGQLEFGF